MDCVVHAQNDQGKMNWRVWSYTNRVYMTVPMNRFQMRAWFKEHVKLRLDQVAILIKRAEVNGTSEPLQFRDLYGRWEEEIA